MIRLSAVIITYNEAKNIRRCISSLKSVADEIVVVDSFSTDNTADLARDLGARVIQNRFDGFTAQKNFAMESASNDFILSLDADEYLSQALIQSIVEAKGKWEADGYTFNRLNNYAGKWIKSCGWYPDAKIRMWDRRKGRWHGGLLHEIVQMQGTARVRHLHGDLLHMAYANADELVKKIQQYSTFYAIENAHRKKVSAFGIMLKGWAAFMKNYILKGGIFDGYEGFIISVSNANGVVYKYAKLLEMNRQLSCSLIITTYNRKDALELVLLSVLNQSRMPSEVIVADDGSRNDTRQLVEDYAEKFPVPLRHVWHEDAGFRLAMIRNKAIASASAEYIVMVDGDIVLPSEFISDHISAAKRGIFIQGSRVLLPSGLTEQMIASKSTAVSFLTKGLKNRMNTIRSGALSKLFSYKNSDVYRVRGANLSFWKQDVLKVNGFNEDFEGWGREDSEFVVRMQNNGIKKFHLKFKGFGYHLYHSESTREMLAKNQEILDQAIANQLHECSNGVNKYMNA